MQVDTLPDDGLLAALVAGVEEDGEWLRASAARLLRSGERNAWLEIVLDEGRNRQIRRLLAAFDIGVLRLVRVAIGAAGAGRTGEGAVAASRARPKWPRCCALRCSSVR